MLVKEKQKIYLPYIKSINSKNIWLDIGCGRGEFLDILRKNNIKAKGLEINKSSFLQAKSKNLDVELIDASTFLKSTPLTFRGISALQVVEHLDYEYLKEFLKKRLMR